MGTPNLDIMKNFGVDSLPNLDTCVLGALELFIEQGLPSFNIHRHGRSLIVGSGNAASTARILFEDHDAVFANESTYQKVLPSIHLVSRGIIISASGGKHAPGIAQYLGERGLEVTLLTCNKDAPAKEHIPDGKVIVFPKQREPYTYNTSTYMGMILSKKREKPQYILDHIENAVKPAVDDFDFSRFDGFYFIVPDKFDKLREIFATKFVELFGRKVARDIFTPEQSKHATTVVQSDAELFVSFGYENNTWGKHRLHIPLPSGAGYAAMMAIGYYVIGKIQAQKPPWFKERIQEYCEEAGRGFDQIIKPIVE